MNALQNAIQQREYETSSVSTQEMRVYIAAMRTGYGITTSALAKEIGTTTDMLRRYERGENVFASKLIERAAQLYFRHIRERGYVSRPIGEVTVDSGQLAIIDPCYLERWQHGEYMPEVNGPANDFDSACKASVSRRGFGPIMDERGIAFSSGHGDGVYPVRAVFDGDGRVVRVEIDMSVE
ncbi:DUF4241 domain-containing protein [Paenibacillus sp. PAMC21692]|uniref:DUF4241 domain-containing protein n=1 Tax=Paenibacillus sp. PAMC21692 TaxID=2762320 RepID=UPI00164D4417|nr:DUF4241 domain-containing protein [Paenibacillus sp. PAMC21692]QNK54548.1 DUF4241 domain-containing protein [Paenibacillus sp. PAMC21692]